MFVNVKTFHLAFVSWNPCISIVFPLRGHVMPKGAKSHTGGQAGRLFRRSFHLTLMPEFKIFHTSLHFSSRKNSFLGSRWGLQEHKSRDAFCFFLTVPAPIATRYIAPKQMFTNQIQHDDNWMEPNLNFLCFNLPVFAKQEPINP